MKSVLYGLAALVVASVASKRFYMKDVDPDVKERFRGKGNLYPLVRGCPEGMMRCDASPDSKCLVSLVKQRDGRCDCNKNCKSGVDCPLAMGPNGEGCNNKADEECEVGTVACDAGKCISEDMFLDDEVNCEWHCIEPSVQDRCRALRISQFTETLEEAQKSSKFEFKQFCMGIMIREFPHDCEKGKSNCTAIDNQRKECKTKSYEKEDWYKKLSDIPATP